MDTKRLTSAFEDLLLEIATPNLLSIRKVSFPTWFATFLAGIYPRLGSIADLVDTLTSCKFIADGEQTDATCTKLDKQVMSGQCLALSYLTLETLFGNAPEEVGGTRVRLVDAHEECHRRHDVCSSRGREAASC
jgi:hypothetical protein